MKAALAFTVAMAGVARADDAATVEWRTYAALRNDVFTELEPPIDDQGFTHDNVFSLRRTHDGVTFGGGFVHRWITSREDRRRWDLVELTAIAERTWPDPFAALAIEHELVAGVRVGPALGGNFGGRYMQNGWHTLTGTGPTLDQGLANDYPASRKLGVLAGGRGRVRVGTDTLHAYGLVDAQGSVGHTGVSSVEAAIGGTAGVRHVGVDLELAVTRYHVGDPWLALPGGYTTGWNLEWRAGVHVAWSRFRISYTYRANEGGSGEPIGVIAFESKR